MDKKKRVVISGVGIVSPAGIGKKRFWDNIKRGRSAIRPITLFDTAKMPNRLAGEITDFNIRKFFSGKGLRNLNRSTLFTLAAAKLGLDDASIKYPIPEKATDYYGVSFGSAAGNLHDAVAFDLKAMTEGSRFVNPADFPNTSCNIIASHISIRFNITGFNTTISSAFSSSHQAIGYAYDMIRNYDYRVVLSGGAEHLSSDIFTAFAKLRCLSGSRSRSDKVLNCPYDRRRNGILISEGACILILEDMKHALSRKAGILAEVKGYGDSFDPEILNRPAISANGAVEAMEKAINMSGISADKISCIIGSANSTRRFDAIEAKAINTVFGGRRYVPVTSIKSIIGEMCSAGGVFNAAAAIMAVKSGYIPPTINYRLSDKYCKLKIVRNKGVKRRLDHILVNSFSHNGHNASMVISRYEK